MNFATTTDQPATIVSRTKGLSHGPVTRLFSPGDLGHNLKPFVFLDRIDMNVSGAGDLFGLHPHSGIATITTVFQGDTVYEDSTGKSGVLVAGGVEWMLAGNGMWHSAKPQAAGRVLGYQLWLALPDHLEQADARSEYLAPSLVPNVGPARVILGEYQGVSSPLPSVSPVTYLHLHLDAGESWVFVPDTSHDVGWLALGSGTLEIDGTPVSNEAVVLDLGQGPLRLVASSPVDVMIGTAVRHPHPLVLGMHSVHTSAQELQRGEDGIRRVRSAMQAAGRL